MFEAPQCSTQIEKGFTVDYKAIYCFTVFYTNFWGLRMFYTDVGFQEDVLNRCLSSTCSVLEADVHGGSAPVPRKCVVSNCTDVIGHT
jgi:hypothetical protein